jgi:hypothetical protein
LQRPSKGNATEGLLALELAGDRSSFIARRGPPATRRHDVSRRSRVLIALFERESSGWRVVLWWTVIDIPLFLLWVGLALWLWDR